MANVEYAPEVAPGNVMRLKKPYVTGDGSSLRTWTHGVVAQPPWNEQRWLPHNPYWRVSLFLYNPDTKEIYLHPAVGIPVYVDVGADELILVKLHTEVGYQDHHHDLYPECRECERGWVREGRDRYGDTGEVRCRACGGFGKVFRPFPKTHPEVTGS